MRSDDSAVIVPDMHAGVIFDVDGSVAGAGGYHPRPLSISLPRNKCLTLSFATPCERRSGVMAARWLRFGPTTWPPYPSRRSWLGTLRWILLGLTRCCW